MNELVAKLKDIKELSDFEIGLLEEYVPSKVISRNEFLLKADQISNEFFLFS